MLVSMTTRRDKRVSNVISERPHRAVGGGWCTGLLVGSGGKRIVSEKIQIYVHL